MQTSLVTLLQEGPVVESLKARFEFMEEQGYFRLRHVKRRQGDEYFKVSVVLLWSFLVCLAGVWRHLDKELTHNQIAKSTPRLSLTASAAATSCCA